jgi:hypothetical protein
VDVAYLQAHGPELRHSSFGICHSIASPVD